ncbi:hypothetical protein BDR06DRAFT_972350 [Suillus hirtellus]|nr:hypothetical protein BDR06DRAFT_972350 [Suillus hirtellus]
MLQHVTTSAEATPAHEFAEHDEARNLYRLLPKSALQNITGSLFPTCEFSFDLAMACEYTFMSAWKNFPFRDTVARVTFREASLERQAVELRVMRKVRGQHGRLYLRIAAVVVFLIAQIGFLSNKTIQDVSE